MPSGNLDKKGSGRVSFGAFLELNFLGLPLFWLDKKLRFGCVSYPSTSSNQSSHGDYLMPALDQTTGFGRSCDCASFARHGTSASTTFFA
jgi:hypothetical protein